jgi:diguanylate cyclase (GGDEF)-like protein
VGVVAKALDELLDVLVDEGVVGDVEDPALELLLGRQLAKDQQVGDLEVGRVLAQLLDRDPAMLEHAGVTVDVGDLRSARSGVRERGVVGHQPEVVLGDLDLAQVHRPDRAVGHLELVRLAGAVVGHGQRVAGLLGGRDAAAVRGSLSLVSHRLSSIGPCSAGPFSQLAGSTTHRGSSPSAWRPMSRTEAPVGIPLARHGSLSARPDAASSGIVGDPAARLAEAVARLARLVGAEQPPEVGDPSSLTAAYTSIVTAAVDHIVGEAEKTARLEMRMSVDPLTGVNNRGAWDEAVVQAEAEAAGGARLAVAIFDLDGLKAVNDTQGHAAGDELLRSFGRILAASARATDYVARIGGDEFAALLRDCNRAGAATWCVRVRDAVAVQNASRPERPIEVSHGYAAATADGGMADAVAAADRALYRAKILDRGSWDATASQPPPQSGSSHAGPRSVR